MNKIISNWADKQTRLKKFYKQLHKDNNVVQVTLTNNTNEIKEVKLWDSKSRPNLSDPIKNTEIGSEQIKVLKNPVDIVFNPALEKYYLVNEASETITVLNLEGKIEDTIDLEIYSDVELKQPIKISCNSNPSSENYGDIAVLCRHAAIVIILSTEQKIKHIADTGEEPVDMVYNTYDGSFWIANSKSTFLTVLSNNYQVKKIDGVTSVLSLGINTINGNIICNDYGEKNILLFDHQGRFLNNIKNFTSEHASFTHFKNSNSFLVTYQENDTILVIDAEKFNITKTINDISEPNNILYDQANSVFYLIDSRNGMLLSLSDTLEVIESENLDKYDRLALCNENLIFLNTTENLIRFRSFSRQPSISFNEGYREVHEEFKNNPAIVNHLKIVALGDARINVLRLMEKSISGFETCKTISLTNSQSAQHFANVNEVFEISGNLIDRHATWSFKINPLQQVTFLIYYNQIEMYNLLPEKSRISTGVQMSKGIPVSWLDNPKDEPPNESTY